MFSKKDDQRFAILHSDSISFMTQCTIIVDKLTGVNYLLASSGEGVGLTPLLDPQGKVIVSSRDELDELQYK